MKPDYYQYNTVMQKGRAMDAINPHLETKRVEEGEEVGTRHLIGPNVVKGPERQPDGSFKPGDDHRMPFEDTQAAGEFQRLLDHATEEA